MKQKKSKLMSKSITMWSCSLLPKQRQVGQTTCTWFTGLVVGPPRLHASRVRNFIQKHYECRMRLAIQLVVQPNHSITRYVSLSPLVVVLNASQMTMFRDWTICLEAVFPINRKHQNIINWCDNVLESCALTSCAWVAWDTDIKVWRIVIV